MPTENRSNDAEGWIACDDGLHLIQIDKNLSHYGWVFRKIDGGLPYSVREATPHEMAHAQARQHLRIGVAQIAGQAPAPRPHPEPIAWMVGTAIWWTREEAERDAADTGLPIVGLGPMTASIPAEQSQAIPVGEVVAFGKGLHEIAWAAGRMPKLGAKLFTQADPNVRWETVAGEQMKVIEQLRSELGEAKGEYDRSANKVAALGAHLAERDALLRDKSGDLIRMAANLISAPLFALQDLQDEDKKMTRARVDHAVDVADARLKDAAYELRRIADALSASAEPSAPAERDHEIPGTSFQRLNALANQGE